MAKRTAVIDIGSNSMRIAIFERTSRFGFHLINETKGKVRIGEGAYANGGVLQELPMQRAYQTLTSFLNLIKSFKCSKTFCIATSALRDAPNSSEFISKINNELGLKIKIIDGKKEAFYGGVSSLNLLEQINEATTIDIGGGSTEFAKIKNGKIIDTFSLNLGTVRLKELFFDSKKPKEELCNFVQNILLQIPDYFASDTIIGMGGSLRAISNSIIEKTNYPLKTVHGFKYDFLEHENFLKDLSESSILNLKSFFIKRDRFDTIREGAFIFNAACKKLKTKQIITNGAGIREGIFLNDMLRNHQGKFPANFHPSLRSLEDRFAKHQDYDLCVMKYALGIFEALKPLHKIDDKFKYELSIAAKLISIGRFLNIYQEHLHSFYFVLNNLNYGFSHKEKVLISLLIKSNGKKLPLNEDIKNYEELLPEPKILDWLSFILAFAKVLNIDYKKRNLEFCFSNQSLCINNAKDLILSMNATKSLIKPSAFAICFRD